MPDKCCVPGCKSNYRSSGDKNYTTVFKFPADTDMRREWLRVIPRKDWLPSKRSVVCANHFEEEDIIKFDSYPNAMGKELKFPRRRPKLKDGAVPRIFANLPHYLSKSVQRKDPNDRRVQPEEDLREKKEEFLAADVIENFTDLCESENRIVQSDIWCRTATKDCVCFYKMSVEGIPKIHASVKIDSCMCVQVCVGNNIVSANDLQWILPKNLKLTLWSQLEDILQSFGSKQPRVYRPHLESLHRYHKSHSDYLSPVKPVEVSDEMDIKEEPFPEEPPMENSCIEENGYGRQSVCSTLPDVGCCGNIKIKQEKEEYCDTVKHELVDTW